MERQFSAESSDRDCLSLAALHLCSHSDVDFAMENSAANAAFQFRIDFSSQESDFLVKIREGYSLQ